MAYKNFKREYHRNRLARKYKNYRHFGSTTFKWGIHRDWADYHNGHGTWFYSRSSGSTYFRPAGAPLVISPRRDRHASFLENRTITHDDITFWDAEELERKYRHHEAKLWTDRGGLVGYGKSKKWIRQKYHSQRRVREAQALHKILREDETWENIHLDMDRGAHWWDIY